MKKIKVVFCGTPDFSIPTLEMLVNHHAVQIQKVVTMPSRPAGRGQELKAPPVAQFALDNKLPLVQCENVNKEDSFLAELEKNPPDIILVLAFAQFLGSKLLTLPRLGCFNIHTSLLPKYRGAAPIQYALLNGDQETGVSIQKMVKKMDAGDLVLSRPIAIAPEETGGQLYTRLKFAAGLATNEFIELALTGKLTYTAQDEKQVSFAPTLAKEDGLIKFTNSDFNKVYNQVRALDPWPGTFFFLNDKRIKVLSIEKFQANLAPGEWKIINDQFVVGLTDSALRISSLQCEGKKICSDAEFINGLKNQLAQGTNFTINP